MILHSSCRPKTCRESRPHHSRRACTPSSYQLETLDTYREKNLFEKAHELCAYWAHATTGRDYMLVWVFCAASVRGQFTGMAKSASVEVTIYSIGLKEPLFDCSAEQAVNPIIKSISARNTIRSPARLSGG